MKLKVYLQKGTITEYDIEGAFFFNGLHLGVKEKGGGFDGLDSTIIPAHNIESLRYNADELAKEMEKQKRDKEGNGQD